jgi:uncharacterized membrane protein
VASPVTHDITVTTVRGRYIAAAVPIMARAYAPATVWHHNYLRRAVVVATVISAMVVVAMISLTFALPMAALARRAITVWAPSIALVCVAAIWLCVHRRTDY